LKHNFKHCKNLFRNLNKKIARKKFYSKLATAIQMKSKGKSRKNKMLADRWIIDPMTRFLRNQSMSGIVLFIAALLALILANSAFTHIFHDLWQTEFMIGIGEHVLSKSLHHWINDGLMAVFFFVVGLELKREIVAGQLNNPRNAILPISAAVGGMIFPALIYLMFNQGEEVSRGWGIPMATDIAFALGILFLLGDRVPVSVKLFITVLAIADDLGAVMVIAFFYTSEIDYYSLLYAAIFLVILIVANKTGVRNTLFYAVVGIGGLWLAFLMSGVHPTIAAVIAAFTIPASVKITESKYSEKAVKLLNDFKQLEPNGKRTVSSDQLKVLQKIRNLTKKALTPLQRLEHSLHYFVAFIVLPLFALSNTGVTFDKNFFEQINSSVTIGVFSGLIAGKIIGIILTAFILIKLKLAKLPEDMNLTHLIGVGFLAAIGFTMSLFVAELAFDNEVYINQAKIGILFASLIASIIGYILMRKASKPLI